MTTYEFYMKVANMLAKSRNDANKSQVQMADLLGVNKKTILNWENGHNRPDPVMLIKWFQVLHLDIIEYFLIEFKGNNILNDLLVAMVLKLSDEHKKALYELDKVYGLENLIDLLKKEIEVLHEE